MNPSIGAFEEIVLLSVCGLTGRAYAVPIHEQIELVGGRDASMGAVYSTLDRLEKKGFLRSRLGPVTHEAGGRRKRYYELTGTGAEALAAARAVRDGLRKRIDPRLRPDLGGI